MSIGQAMELAMKGMTNRGKPMMVFDWRKAAEIIKERNAQAARAGLRGDWRGTGGPILEGGAIVPADATYTYLSSTWATPELEVDGEIMACYVMEDETDWDEKTYWPPEARKVLTGK